MCSAPRIPAPQLPPERQMSRAPINVMAGSAGQRVRDRMRGMSDTILTSGQGVTTAADVAKKTLLGQ